MDTLDIVIESGPWDATQFSCVAEQAVRAVLSHIILDPEETEISVLACDDARIAALNADFRGKAVPTNVLSWPAQILSRPGSGAAPGTPARGFDGLIELGDIALSFDTCAREADLAGKPMDDHLTHLIVHGVLHLLGYDHVDDGDAALMEKIEVEILGNLGLDDPYTTTQTTTGAQ
ncbi:rRNA maturation RNase YbeY [uncultured Sulfitobacter sp.]|uniref:rRNA maturation RNase YbeY n=1 Tax=uncultured Sulfitobacter sp. TaxID=191468 RepID=UPI002635387C|nr:rRNA maturation RNase YbeY [uncultured Sulfitobacter sp.]